MFDLGMIDRHFPMDDYRDGQKKCIEFALNAFNNGKKIVILECPTGSGKSPIGMTIADMVNRSYYLTITKVLQDQLINDFSTSLNELKGRNAYPCTFIKHHGKKIVDGGIVSQKKLQQLQGEINNCAEGFCRKSSILNGLTATEQKKCDLCFQDTEKHIDGVRVPQGELKKLPPGMIYSACPYYEKVYRAVGGRKVVMNFSSFLYQTTMTRRFDRPRDLLIIDEAHNIEPQLLDFISLTINDIHLQKFGIFIPKFSDPMDYYVWMEEAKINDALNQIIGQAKQDENNKLQDEMERVQQKYKMFQENILEEDSEWVCEYDVTKTASGQHRSVTLKPVFVKKFVNGLLFGKAKRILMMSATVLDVNVMCRSLGINKDHVAAYRMKNRFPKENRPIYIQPAAKCTGGKSAMSKWGPKLVRAVNDIVDKYPGKKGIIHTHNFAITNLLAEDCRKGVRSRFLLQRDFPTKAHLLEEHSRRRDSVIVAPAMHEGINLSGDLSRFQIICKMPYANCFDDLQLNKRVEIDRAYYTWLTALKLVQSYGRSVRSETDYADTYIIDESIHKLLRDAGKMIPKWFLEAIA